MCICYIIIRSEDFTELINTSMDYVDEIYNESTEDIKAVYQDILWALFRKMNVPVEEARDKLARLEDDGMGYLFANMEKMDIQAERRNTQLARQELEKANQRLNTIFGQLVSICKGRDMSMEETLICLQKEYGLSETEAASAVEQFWQHK